MDNDTMCEKQPRQKLGGWEDAQQVKGFSDLAKNHSSIPRIHTG